MKENGEAQKSGGPSLLLYADLAYYGTWKYVSEGTVKVTFTKYGKVYLAEPAGSLKQSMSGYYHLDHAAGTFRDAENPRGTGSTGRREDQRSSGRANDGRE